MELKDAPEVCTPLDLGIAGAQQALDHAKRKISGWDEMALGWVRLLALQQQTMTSEDVRAYAAEKNLPNPPDQRAWGAIMPKAAKAGFIHKARAPLGGDVWVTGKNRQAHGRPVRVWRSALCVQHVTHVSVSV